MGFWRYFMKERLISTLVMLPLLLLVAVGGIPLYVAGLIIMSMGLHEFYKAFNNIDFKPIDHLGYAFVAFVFIANIKGHGMHVYPYILFTCFIISIFYVLKQRRNVMDICITFSGILYVCFSFNCIILMIDTLPMGSIMVWLIFIISFSTDIFAYLVGRKFGKHKLLPEVSPKKTIEGSLGGIVGTLVLCLIFAKVFNLSIPIAVFVSISGSVIAQLGDLAASSIKRYVGIKDFAKLIPGHGGILDRFDSVILVAPYVYLFYHLLLLGNVIK